MILYFLIFLTNYYWFSIQQTTNIINTNNLYSFDVHCYGNKTIDKFA